MTEEIAKLKLKVKSLEQRLKTLELRAGRPDGDAPPPHMAMILEKLDVISSSIGRFPSRPSSENSSEPPSPKKFTYHDTRNVNLLPRYRTP